MKKQYGRLLLATIALCVISVLIMVFSLQYSNKNVRSEFAPPVFDTSAVKGIPDVPDGLDWSELDAKVYKVSVCGFLQPKDHMVAVWLTNPESNSVWLKLRILDEKGSILGETGLIKPGEYVISAELDQVPRSGTPAILKIMAYEPETYYSAGAVSLNTIIQ